MKLIKNPKTPRVSSYTRARCVELNAGGVLGDEDSVPDSQITVVLLTRMHILPCIRCSLPTPGLFCTLFVFEGACAACRGLGLAQTMSRM